MKFIRISRETRIPEGTQGFVTNSQGQGVKENAVKSVLYFEKVLNEKRFFHVYYLIYVSTCVCSA